MTKIAVGDKVNYYCNSQMTMRDGVVTAVDVPVEWLWEWAEHGTVMQSPRVDPKEGTRAQRPLGVQINGNLTRPYWGGGLGLVGDYDKSKVQS
jgi:hypothetical protein